MERLIKLAESPSPTHRAEARSRLDNAPTLRAGSRFYWNAWHDLQSERVNGKSIGSIPFGKIVGYADEYNVEMREEFIRIMRRLDDWFVADTNTKIREEMERASRRSKG